MTRILITKKLVKPLRIAAVFILLCSLLPGLSLKAQVSTGYIWSQSFQTYKSDTSTTSVTPANIFSTGWDDNTYTTYKFPFNFTYNGTLYTGGTSTIGLDSDGWIAFSTTGSITMTGTTAGGSWVSASDHTGVYLSGTANNNGICGFNSDIEDQDLLTFTGNTLSGSRVISAITDFSNLRVGTRLSGTGITNGTIITKLNPATSSITISTTATVTDAAAVLTPWSSIYAFIRGVAPYRQFVIQWTKVTRYGTAGDDFSFQIVLNEGGLNPVYQTLQAVYGDCKATNLTPQNSQVGLRGASSADYNARKTATNWSATAAATANTDVCVLTPSIFPSSGLTYTWSPACGGVPSNAGAISGPLNVCPGTSADYSIPGVPGAIFYNWTYTGTNTISSGTSTLPLNTLIFDFTATGGTLTVTPGNLCGLGASSSIVISMNGLPTASINYPASSYCTSAAAATPTITGTAGGTFTALPLGLTINASTGQITPSTSSAGNYVVSYTYTSGCTAIATANITINAGPAVVATATPATVCTAPNSSQLQASVPVTGYSLNSIAHTSLTPSAGSTVVWNTYQLDAISGSIAMPFTFNYFGSAITNFFVSTEGYVQLQTGTAVQWTPQTLPNAAIPNNIVCLAWADLIVDPSSNPGSSVRYFVNGVAPNRILVVDYINLRFLAGSGQNVTGQIRLYENDSHIEIAAGSVNDNSDPWNKTMGIENSTGTVAVTPPGRNNTVWNTTLEAWSFVPTTNTYTYLWSPATYLTNPAIANPVANNLAGTTSYTVTVTNTNTGCSGTASAAVTVSAPLNGTYTVGVGGNYTTLTAAVNAYNSLCIGGPVIFSLIDNTYPSETFPIVINSNGYASSVNTLTIKPALTKLPVITGNNADAIIKLNGADWVTIDGSNTIGGTTRNLTLINTNSASLTSTIVWLASAAVGNGATNNNIINCNFTGNSPTTTFTSLLSSGIVPGTVAEAANDKNNYSNNYFIRALTAIAIVGPNGNETGTVITNNTIGSATPGDKLGWSGIEIYQQANCVIKGNTIFGITTSDFSIITSGITVLGTQSNDTISNNKISDIKHTNTGGYGANGIYLGASTTASNITVFNNFIFNVAGYGFNDFNYYDNGYGLVIDYGGGYKIYHNTVQMNVGPSLNGNHRSAAVLVSNYVTTASSIDMRNNIFGNTQTVGGANSRYAILCTAANTVFSFNDNNAYYSIGSTWLSCKGSNGTQSASIAALRTSLGLNTASVGLAATPIYVTTSDYHLQSVAGNSIVSNLGVAIPTFTTDYDGNTRNGYTPDMGADEFVMPNAGSWVGRKSIDWLDPVNWEDNVVPTGTTDVTLTGGYINMPTIVTTQAVRGLAISAPVITNIPVLTLTNSTLQINGPFTRVTGGTIIANTGTVEMNSTTAAQNIPAGVFQNNNLLNLVIGNTNNTTGVSILGALDIYRSVAFSAGGLRLTTNNLLTFKSTATATAWLGNVTGKTITGNAIIERYIPTGINHGKSWQLLAAPVRGAQSVFASWQEANVPLGNLRPGFGTTISSEKAGATTRGYDFLTATGGPSIKTYDAATGTFLGIDNGVALTSAVNISNQKGYMILVRGDRSVQTSVAAANPTVLRTNGSLYTATTGQIPPVTTVLANKFATIGNPYPSAIDFTAITKTAGVDDVFYLWDPLLPGSLLLGGYQTITGVTGYLPTPGSPNYPAGVPVKTIQSGQAFYVHGTAGGTVTFTEAAKVSGSQLVLRPGTTVQNRKLLVSNLYKVSSMNLGAVDGNVIAFDKNFSNLLDAKDALKINHADENFGISSNQRLLSVEARKPVKITDTVFYNISNLRKEAYQFRFAPSNLQAANLHAYLVDAYLGIFTDISLTDSSIVDFTVNTDPASGANNRFYLIFKKLEVLPVTFTQISAKRNSDEVVQVNWKVESELNIHLYEVEKSADGKHFFKFNGDNPSTNNGSAAAYFSLDKTALKSDNFYRVKAISNDGVSQYSAVVKVGTISMEASITAYPNPVTEKVLYVSFNNQQPGTYQLRLLNKLGQVTISRSVEISGTNVISSFPLTKEMSSGSYQLIITTEEGGRFSQQLIVK